MLQLILHIERSSQSTYCRTQNFHWEENFHKHSRFIDLWKIPPSKVLLSNSLYHDGSEIFLHLTLYCQNLISVKISSIFSENFFPWKVHVMQYYKLQCPVQDKLLCISIYRGIITITIKTSFASLKCITILSYYT